MKFLLLLSYDGTKFCGWQVQNELPTIQGELTLAATEIFKTKVDVSGCSRTDSGVHALNYYCTLDVKDFHANIPCENLVLALNAKIPKEISVNFAKTVDNDFHVRYNVKYKQYKYLIDNSKIRNPFMVNRAWHIPNTLDLKSMELAAMNFVGEHDFRSFMASGSNIIDTVRNVYNVSLTKEDNVISFRVCANGFLYNMVRIMVGTLVNVGTGKKSPNEVKEIITSCDRNRAGLTAPPHGLYLECVEY